MVRSSNQMTENHSRFSTTSNYFNRVGKLALKSTIKSHTLKLQNKLIIYSKIIPSMPIFYHSFVSSLEYY